MDEQQRAVEASLFNDTSMYNDIMALPHHDSHAHLRMARGDRAAQFAPFAALTGYQELIQTKAKIYQHKQYPTPAQAEVVSGALKQLDQDDQPTIRLNYFNDAVGYYQTMVTTLLKIDWDQGRLRLADQEPIAIANVRRIVRAES